MLEILRENRIRNDTFVLFRALDRPCIKHRDRSMEPNGPTGFQRAVRETVYRSFIEQGRPPTAWEVGEELRSQSSQVEEALAELAEMHALVLRDDGRSVSMAMPFSADPTPYRVTSGSRSWYANCAWDAPGIGAVIRQSVSVAWTCPITQTPAVFECDSRLCAPSDGVVHFLVPAAQWWDDIAFT